MPRPSERTEVRFLADVPGHQMRVELGSRLLIGLGSFVFSLLGTLRMRRLIHGAERLWARLVVRLLRIRLDMDGREHIDPGQTYVVVSLHEGFADAVALLHLGMPMRFLVRDELFGWRALGRYLAATGQIEVEEEATRAGLRSMYRAIADATSEGDSLTVFAQGSILGVEVAFRRGAFRIARQFGLPVLPVVVTGSHRVWEHPYAPTVRLDQRVSVRVLTPIDPDRLDASVERDLERRMKEIALDPSTAAPRQFVPERDGWWDDYRYEIDPDFPDLARRVAAHQ